MPYARQWEVMTKTMIIGATHNTPIIFAILVFFHRPMAEVPTQQEDLGQGAQSLSSFGPRIISLVFCIYSICPNMYVLSRFRGSSLHSFLASLYVYLPPPAAKAVGGSMFVGDHILWSHVNC